jgi:hypothetical protein
MKSNDGIIFEKVRDFLKEKTNVLRAASRQGIPLKVVAGEVERVEAESGGSAEALAPNPEVEGVGKATGEPAGSAAAQATLNTRHLAMLNTRVATGTNPLPKADLERAGTVIIARVWNPR